MSQNPVNLAVRFALEVAAVIGLFRLGLGLTDGFAALLVAVLVSSAALAAWGTFNVPGDRSRSGSVPVRVSGAVRLLIEIVVLGGGAIGWFLSGPVWFAWSYTIVLIMHYGLSFDRVGWLLGVGSDSP